ncbi:MAG: IS110 family transposase [Chloroflexi bacterium]|nr:IS110 family transposase [Chloroflexota bacterium]MBV9599489.1 IS110 family transposase [Chloroflexota bacterium]
MSAEQAAFLVQLPGIGVHNAMLLLAAIGDIRRFDAAHKLVGYAGLGARAHSSGEEQYGGRITRQGRRDIRSTMVEAAWVAVGTHPHWKELFEQLAVRVGKPKAVVAIARKMLVVVWHVLTKHLADRAAVPEKVAGKFLEWPWKLGRDNRGGLDSGTFIRRELRRLQLGDTITAVSRGKRTFPVPLGEASQAAV